MSNDKAFEAKDYGLVVRGICNGFREYTRKTSGVIVRQLLVNIPGATSSLQVELESGADISPYQPMAPVMMKIIPIFYDGRLTGFAKA